MQKNAVGDIQGLYSETRQSMDVLYTYDAKRTHLPKNAYPPHQTLTKSPQIGIL
jgi:hypothetical protein